MEQSLILDRYRPLAELGSGGHATVTLAYDTRMGRRVAIKRLPLPLDAHGRPRRTGLTEARTVAMLNHPAIVTVHEWESDADEAFLIMEAVDGVSLAELLDHLGRLDLDEAAGVIGTVAHALAFAHDNGVLHLDIKPGNVLVTRDGDVKVTDFGISALTGVEGTASAEEGTIGFMPPEQLRGEALDARTDQWALAALAFESLTGANPFDAVSLEGALARAESDGVHVPSEFVRGLPRALDAVLLAALAPEPSERYPDIAAFADALIPHLGDAAAGRESLGALVTSLTADEVAEEAEAYARLGVWDRLASLAPWVTAAWAAAVCGWLAHTALEPWALGRLATWVGTALIGVSAAAAPALGLALALGTLAIAAFRLGPLPGVVMLAIGAVAWLAIGRRGRGDSLLAATAPVAGLVRLGFAAPLLAGFTFEPPVAAASSAFAAVALMTVSAMSGSGSPLLVPTAPVLLNPWPELEVAGRLQALVGVGPLIAVVAWAACGWVVSLLCRRGTRLSGAFGVAVGAGVLLGGYALWSLADPRLLWPSTPVLQQLGLSLILLTVVIALGAPVRGEGGDEKPPSRKAR